MAPSITTCQGFSPSSLASPRKTTDDALPFSPSTLSLSSSSSSSHSDVSLRFLTTRRGFSLRSPRRRPLSVVAMAPPKPGGKAKKVVGLIKLALEAGKATPAPPVGPALGSKGVNRMAFCKAIKPVILSLWRLRSMMTRALLSFFEDASGFSSAT